MYRDFLKHFFTFWWTFTHPASIRTVFWNRPPFLKSKLNTASVKCITFFYLYLEQYQWRRWKWHTPIGTTVGLSVRSKWSWRRQQVRSSIAFSDLFSLSFFLSFFNEMNHSRQCLRHTPTTRRRAEERSRCTKKIA